MTPLEKSFTVMMSVFLVIMSIGAVSGETGSVYVESHSQIQDGDQFTNRSVLADFYIGDDRVTDYMWEDFDDTTYDYIDGTSCRWKSLATTGTHTCVSQDTLTDFFGDGGLVINSTDSEAAFPMATKTTSAIHIDNSTLTDDVFTWEFDFMLEEDTEPFSMRFDVGGFSIFYNLSTAATYMDSHITLPAPDVGQNYTYNVTSGEWHHVITSVSNSFSDGFNVTSFINGYSVSVGMSKQSLPANSGLNAVWMYLPASSGNSNDLGRDLLFDNLIMYNGSFTEDEIWRAMSQTYQTELIMDIIPVILTVTVFSMIIAVVRKIKL